jgi:predicted RNA-binding Zn-ribbon protein involved in translation (DUF1610 family)
MITVSMWSPQEAPAVLRSGGLGSIKESIVRGNRGGVPKARFFCENCGAEVTAGAASCPRCHRVFSSVRCPKCGFMGEPADFRSGCPTCGYLQATEQLSGAARPAGSSPPAKKSFLSRASSRVAIIGLLVALAVLVVVLFLRP